MSLRLASLRTLPRSASLRPLNLALRRYITEDKQPKPRKVFSAGIGSLRIELFDHKEEGTSASAAGKAGQSRREPNVDRSVVAPGSPGGENASDPTIPPKPDVGLPEGAEVETPGKAA